MVTPRFGISRQWHRINSVSSRFHEDVVHVVLFVRNCVTVLRISQLLLDPSINFLCNIRTFCGTCDLLSPYNTVTPHHRCALSNGQQRFAHRCLNTSNSEARSPIVTTINAQLFVEFDEFSSCRAGNEITFTRNRRSERDTLRPCRLSCTCVDSNLDPVRTSHLLRLLKCINIEVSHAAFINFNFWFNN